MKKVFTYLILASLFLVNPVFAAGDPYFNEQWYLEQIGATEIWSTTKGSENIVVAVIDTGVDLDHPDLQNNIWNNPDEIAGNGIDDDQNGFIDDKHGWDFIENKNSPEPKFNGISNKQAVSHGTFVAGLIAAIHDNNRGIKGVTAKTKIMPLVSLNYTGWGTSNHVSQAVDYAVNNGADIINLSFGGNEYSTKLKKSIIQAYNQGVLVVAAAGNALNGDEIGANLSDDPLYPICYDQDFSVNRILGVIASDKNNQVADFTNYGAGCADLAAPGLDLISTVYQDSSRSFYLDYYAQNWSGSSFSAALVSGAAALLKSIDKGLIPAEMISLLKENSSLLFTEKKHENKVGQGVLNIKKAITSIYTGEPIDFSDEEQMDIDNSQPKTPFQQNPDTSKVRDFHNFYFAPKSGASGYFQKIDNSFNLKKQVEIFFGDKFKGANIQLGDINNDQLNEIIVGATKGANSYVRIVDNNGDVSKSWLAFEYEFIGGVKADAADLDNDGLAEVVAAPQSGREPVVRIFDINGNKKSEFFAYNRNYIGGLDVVLGDVDGDDEIEIITAPNAGLLPKVKVFSANGELESSLVSYNPNFLGGVNIALADVNNNGVLDIITGAGSGGGPHVQVFDSQGNRLVSFMAYDTSFRGGVEVAGIDWNSDGYTDIVTAAGPGGIPHVRVFTGTGDLITEKLVLPADFVSGINIVAD